MKENLLDYENKNPFFETKPKYLTGLQTMCTNHKHVWGN